MGRIFRHGLSAAATSLALLGVSLAGVARGQRITEFPIPVANSGPFAITAGPDGNLWFTQVSVGAEGIGKITPAGVISEVASLPVDSNPLGITAGPDGNLWFTETFPQKIGRITPAGVLTEFSTPNAFPAGIAAGSDGSLWFTDYGGNKSVGRITPDGVVTEFTLPTAGSGPFGITAGPDGNLWFTEQLGNQIGRITTAGVITEFPIPTSDSNPRGITIGSDGNLWFTEQIGKIGRITTNGVITEFDVSTGVGLEGITAGPDRNLWFAEANAVGRITTAGVFTEFPTGGKPAGIVAGPDDALWFAENTANQIGRITTGPCVTHGSALCLNGGRFEVTARWEIRSRAEIGNGTAVSLTSDSGYFWFFNPSNIEVLVKVLNACSLDDARYWVFAGGLTNVGVTITVTDMQTLATKIYTNPDGTAFQPIQDTSAFSTCP